MRETLLLDFDSTITRRDTTRFFILALLRQRPWLFFIIAYSLFLIAISRSGQRLQESKDRCIGLLLKRLEQHRLDLALNRYCQAVRPLLRSELTDVIYDKHDQGLRILVVTASADFAVRAVLADLPVTVIGTRFQQDERGFNGLVHLPSCYGADKPGCIERALGAPLTDHRFVEAWSDSASDMPMMALAEHRVWICSKKNLDYLKMSDPKGIFLALD